MTNPYVLPEIDVEEESSDQVDMINHPPHYNDHPVFSNECLTYTSKMMFGQGNAFKYLWRAGRKGPELEDMKKFIFYTMDYRCVKTIPLPPHMIQEMKRELKVYAEQYPDDVDTIERAKLLINLAAGVM